MNLKKIFFFIMGVFCLSCVLNRSCLALKISNKERNEIIKKFCNRTIYRRGKTITLMVYKNKLKNSFYFQHRKKNGQKFILELISDSLEFKPALSFEPVNSNEFDESNVKNLIEAYAHDLVSKMDFFEIKDFTSEFISFGIDLELYFKDNSRLIYVSNLEKISNSQWKSYINDGKKIDEHWYYYP